MQIAVSQNITNWRPLRNHIGLVSNDLAEIRNHMSQCLFPHDLRPTAPCKIVFHHHFAELGEIALSYTDYGSPDSHFKVVAPSMSDMFAVSLTLGGTVEIFHAGEKLTARSGDLLLLQPGASLTMNMSGDFRPLTLWAKRSTIERALSGELGYALPEPLKFDAQSLVGPAHAPQIVRAIASVCEDLGACDSYMSLPRVSRHAERMLLGLLISVIPHNYTAVLNAEVSQAAPYYVKRVMQYVAQNLKSDIAFQDLVAASGVSARSLQSAFQRFVGETPMTFVKSMRLDMARLELCKTEGSDVTGVAFDCGFTQLSKFAADYRKRFGISPSQTRSSLNFH